MSPAYQPIVWQHPTEFNAVYTAGLAQLHSSVPNVPTLATVPPILLAAAPQFVFTTPAGDVEAVPAMFPALCDVPLLNTTAAFQQSVELTAAMLHSRHHHYAVTNPLYSANGNSADTDDRGCDRFVVSTAAVSSSFLPDSVLFTSAGAYPTLLIPGVDGSASQIDSAIPGVVYMQSPPLASH
jgi:hypothetical protein